MDFRLGSDQHDPGTLPEFPLLVGDHHGCDLCPRNPTGVLSPLLSWAQTASPWVHAIGLPHEPPVSGDRFSLVAVALSLRCTLAQLLGLARLGSARPGLGWTGILDAKKET